MSIFGSNITRPTPHVNKTIEERRAELVRGNSPTALSSPSKKIRFGRILPFVMIALVIFVFPMIAKRGQPDGIVDENGVVTTVLSPDYSEYSSLSVIAEEADFILRGIVVERGIPEYIETENQDGKTSKTMFTPVQLQVITPIKGEFKDGMAAYLELGGVTEKEVVEVSGMLPLNIDDEVFLFYKKSGTGFGKWSVYMVNNKTVTVLSERLPPNLSSISKTTSFPVAEFEELLKVLI